MGHYEENDKNTDFKYRDRQEEIIRVRNRKMEYRMFKQATAWAAVYNIVKQPNRMISQLA
jgi:hypothetical protein